MSAGSVEDALIEELARAAVVQTAPEELPLFRPTSEAYFADPAALDRRGGDDQMLGFGLEAAAVLVTPIALKVAKDVIGFVVDQIRGRAREEGAAAFDRFADRVLHREDEPAGEAPAGGAEEPELTDEELEQVHALALEKAQLLKLPPDKARLLADSLVGSLATA